MDRWIGKVAVLTGASSGIGAATAEKLVKEGLIVVGFARRKEKLNQLSEKLKNCKGKFYPVQANVTKENEVVDAFNWTKSNLGPIHILINNAGVVRNTSLIDGDAAKWKEVLDTNVLGLCVATREAIRDMRANNVSGHVIHINSIAGHKVEKTYNTNLYHSSKFAVTALTEVLRNELIANKLNIKITSLSPGLVNTEIIEASGYNPSLISKRPSLESEDIANAILYVLRTPPHVQVVGFDINKTNLEKFSSQINSKPSKGKFYGLQVNVTKEDQVLEGFKWVQNNLGPIHILVNCAGIGRNTTLIDGDAEKWKEVLDTNVFGLCLTTREAVKNMKTNKVNGHIIHMNSISGHKVLPQSNTNVYSASKFAVTALTETLRYEFLSEKLKIKVTSISPGNVKTKLMESAGYNEKVVQAISRWPSLNPEDVADGIVFVLGTPPHVQVLELTIRPTGGDY